MSQVKIQIVGLSILGPLSVFRPAASRLTFPIFYHPLQPVGGLQILFCVGKCISMSSKVGGLGTKSQVWLPTT